MNTQAKTATVLVCTKCNQGYKTIHDPPNSVVDVDTDYVYVRKGRCDDCSHKKAKGLTAVLLGAKPTL